jgi:dihydroorotate dehydrogenase electron transfer subunit
VSVLAAKQRLWASVESSRALGPGIFELVLRAPKVATMAQPGQFIHLRIGEGLDPLLRRPLSIGVVSGDSIAILYRVVGHGTDLLSHATIGDRFDLLGPLGHPHTLHPQRTALLVAGGLGIATMPFLARRLFESGCADVRLIYGARAADELVWADRLKALGVEIHLATDDGSLGHHGLCTDLLLRMLPAIERPTAIYACGPEPMFQAILRGVTDPGTSIQLSYEQRMGCGFGACMACAVETRDGYVRACTEGPVLDGALFR